MRTWNTLSGLSLSCLAISLSLPVHAQEAAPVTREPVSISTPSAPQGDEGKLYGASSVSKADRGFFIKVAEGNLAEIAAAKQALVKSNDAEIKRFAEHMTDDHSMALDQLSMLARNKHVELPSVPSEKHRKLAARMEEMSAIDFNSQYAKAAVVDHRAMLKVLDKMTSSATDTDLKALAEKMKPQVQSHLKAALALTAPSAQ